MRYSTSFLATAALAASAAAYPTVKRFASNDTITDGDVLNYALTLEHLEATFYREGLANFSASAFQSANISGYVRNRIEQIATHEATHVTFLTNALQAVNVPPAAACQYNFNFTTPEDFIATAGILESVGTSAYIGAAGFFYNKDYLTAAGSITATEARHASWIQSAGESSNPWGGAFETPLTLNQVYTLASQFIVSCPDGNPTILATANPVLTIEPFESDTDATFTFSADNGDNSSTNAGNSSLYAAVLSGLSAEYLPVMNTTNNNGSYEARLPANICGPAFVLLTTSNDTTNGTADANVVAGPAVSRFPCSSTQNPFNVSASG